MKAIIDRLKKSNEFLNAFTLHNVLDAEATDNIRKCVIKNELAIEEYKKLVNGVSTSDEALPIAGVVGQSEQLAHCTDADHHARRFFGGEKQCKKCGHTLR